jgi:hypothetical protein
MTPHVCSATDAALAIRTYTTKARLFSNGPFVPYFFAILHRRIPQPQPRPDQVDERNIWVRLEIYLKCIQFGCLEGHNDRIVLLNALILLFV